MGSVAADRPEPLGRRYRLIERLGAGGMSVVWLARDEILGRQVAVKVLVPQFANDQAFRYQIRTEAQAAARLCHPHITNVYDYGESEELGHTVPYVVMELVDGTSLSSQLGSDGTLPWREAVRIAAEVSSALAAAHARGVVHRDVTPSNVMLTSAGVKVVDFGISALVGENGLGPDGAVLGTPAYLAPERLDNRRVTAASDVYAVGLLLYRMLTGRLPWRASTATQMLRAHIYTDPEPMPYIAELPGAVSDIVHRCLAKCPEDRPVSLAVAQTLTDAAGMAAPFPSRAGRERHLGQSCTTVSIVAGTTGRPTSGTDEPVPTPGNRSRRRGRQLAGVAAAAGLVATGVGIWIVTGGQSAGAASQSLEAYPSVPPIRPCLVEFTLRNDSGTEFTAAMTLTNTSGEELRDWTMRFTFPGEQVVTGTDPGVRQYGATVEVLPSGPLATLPPGATHETVFTGHYSGTNQLPLEFWMDAQSCKARVSGVSGSPSTQNAVGSPGQGGKTTPATTRKAPGEDDDDEDDD